MAVHEKDLNIGGEAETQGERGGDQTGTGGKEAEETRQEQSGSQRNEELEPPDVGEGEEELARVCQDDFHRREEKDSQRRKEIAQQDSQEGLFAHESDPFRIHDSGVMNGLANP